ncbi:MAG: glycoside hydrolase family 10 protein [Bacteroidales bacterium]
MKRINILITLLLVATSVFSQKREFRGLWVATVANIDWPSKAGLSVEQQKQEALAILDTMATMNFNTVIFQVRCAGDALYRTQLAPWSKYLTGTEGKDPGYDPLAFWIEETHKRNMEFHAWMNPYRVSMNLTSEHGQAHVEKFRPDWIVEYGGKKYLNPGIKEVSDYVTKIVSEVVDKYDIDGVHFDDYFYPYPVADAEFRDSKQFASRSDKSLNLAEWRRANINSFIRSVNASIKNIKPYVKFGISPFGVWRNASTDEEGSATRGGVQLYDDLYADVPYWARMGWLDYVAVQIYWARSNPYAGFDVLSDWWKRQCADRNYYLGLGLYKFNSGNSNRDWDNPNELLAQIEKSRSYGIDGFAMFSAKHLNRDLLGLQKTLKSELLSKPVLQPLMPWLDDEAPAAPAITQSDKKSVEWRNPSAEKCSYVVYLYDEDADFDKENAEFIYKITRESRIDFEKVKGAKNKKYKLRVSALDRLGNESKLTAPVQLKLKIK